MGSKQVLPLWARVDRGVMPLKEYSIFTRAPEQELHHMMQFNVISRRICFFFFKSKQCSRKICVPSLKTKFKKNKINRIKKISVHTCSFSMVPSKATVL